MALWSKKVAVRDDTVTIFAVTILCFHWGFTYGLLDGVHRTHFIHANSHYCSSSDLISASMASGLSAAYFGAHFLCPWTISGWILRRYGFWVTFMTGLTEVK